MSTLRGLLPVVYVATLAASGCALLNQQQTKEKNDPFTVTEAKVEKARHEAEAVPSIRSVQDYANATASFSYDHPQWDPSAHVARLNTLAEQCAPEARDERSQGRLEGVRAMIRIAARDFAGAKAINRKRFEKNFIPDMFNDYINILSKVSGPASAQEECRFWYGNAGSEARRYEVAGQCIKAFTTSSDDGYGWLPPEDVSKVRDEFVIRSAENQQSTGRQKREDARREGRYFSANYRGLIEVRVNSRCPQQTFLAASAAARAPLAQRFPIAAHSTNVHNVQIQADHLLWLVDESGHRLAVARMDMWNSGLIIGSNCHSLLPAR